MPIGMIHKLVHLSQQTYQPNSKLIPGHNDKGYGTIDDGGGREVYFSHDAVPGIHGFDDLAPRPGGRVHPRRWPILASESCQRNNRRR